MEATFLLRIIFNKSGVPLKSRLQTCQVVSFSLQALIVDMKLVLSISISKLFIEKFNLI